MRNVYNIKLLLNKLPKPDSYPITHKSVSSERTKFTLMLWNKTSFFFQINV